MKPADQAKQLAAQALDKLQAALDAGRSDTLAALLRTVARFHEYSFRNIILILSQRPDATRVAGYKTWQALGRQVRRGESGIIIIAPMLLRNGDDEQDTDEPDRRDADRSLRFRAAYVFDIAQTDGEPLPELSEVTGDPRHYTERLESLIRSRAIHLKYVPADAIGGAQGASLGGAILVQQDLLAAEHFSTLAHELAHELLHRADGQQRPPEVVRETEAEAVAFVVCEAVGLHAGDAASDYIQLYTGDADTLAASLDRIQKTVAIIIEGLHAES